MSNKTLRQQSVMLFYEMEEDISPNNEHQFRTIVAVCYIFNASMHVTVTNT